MHHASVKELMFIYYLPSICILNLILLNMDSQIVLFSISRI